MWTWVIAQARTREPDVFFIGEAYDDDPAKVPGSDPVVAGLNGGRGNVMFDLLNAGFNAVYDAPVYQALKEWTIPGAGPTTSITPFRMILFVIIRFATPKTTTKSG